MDDGLYVADYVGARTVATVGRSMARIDASRRDIASSRKLRWQTARNFGPLRARVRCFVNPQELPRVQAGYNIMPKRCDACRRSILLGSPEYDIGFAALTFVLDADCFGIWQDELAAAKRQ